MLPNDGGDGDSGANNRQNHPVLTTATPTKVLGTLNSTPNTRFHIEIFRTDPDASGHGEGRFFLGAVETITDGVGLANFGLGGLSLAAGQSVTATTSVFGSHPDPFEDTPLLQDTSEFALNRAVGSESGPSASTIAFAGAGVSVSEGDGNAVLSVVRSGVTTGTASASFYLSSLTAGANTDFGLVAGTVNFAAGQTQQNITVPILNDSANEATQTFSMHLGSATGAVLLSPTVTVVTILDDDPLPTFSVPAVLSITEGHSGTSVVEVPLNLSAPSELPVTAAFSVNGLLQSGTATVGVDFNALTIVLQTVIFAPGETQKTATIGILGDEIVEPDETILLLPSHATNGTTSLNPCTITIVNDDDPSAGTLQFSAASYSVAEEAGSATITVSRTGGTGGAASVDYALTGGTATAGTDFTAANASGTLQFAHGQSSASFAIQINDDNEVEGSESVVLSFLGVTGASAGTPPTTTLTITDNEFHVAISGRVLEADGTPIPGVSVNLSGAQSVLTTTDASGNYGFGSLLPGQSYTVTATAPGWTFDPPSLAFPSLAATQSGQDFIGTALPAPALAVDLLPDGRIAITWASPSPGWSLMHSTTLERASWQPVTTPPIVRGGLNNVYLLPDGRDFFQLHLAD